jgi:hypothetical protein
MVIVRNMLKLDYAMQVIRAHVSECYLFAGHVSPFWLKKYLPLPLQEKIVNALSLKTSSSELQGYCLMWDLRPFMEDDVMHLAWKMCP